MASNKAKRNMCEGQLLAINVAIERFRTASLPNQGTTKGFLILQRELLDRIEAQYLKIQTLIIYDAATPEEEEVEIAEISSFLDKWWHVDNQITRMLVLYEMRQPTSSSTMANANACSSQLSCNKDVWSNHITDCIGKLTNADKFMAEPCLTGERSSKCSRVCNLLEKPLPPSKNYSYTLSKSQHSYFHLEKDVPAHAVNKSEFCVSCLSCKLVKSQNDKYQVCPTIDSKLNVNSVQVSFTFCYLIQVFVKQLSFLLINIVSVSSTCIVATPSAQFAAGVKPKCNVYDGSSLNNFMDSLTLVGARANVPFAANRVASLNCQLNLNFMLQAFSITVTRCKNLNELSCWLNKNSTNGFSCNLQLRLSPPHVDVVPMSSTIIEIIINNVISKSMAFDVSNNSTSLSMYANLMSKPLQLSMCSDEGALEGSESMLVIQRIIKELSFKTTTISGCLNHGSSHKRVLVMNTPPCKQIFKVSVTPDDQSKEVLEKIDANSDLIQCKVQLKSKLVSEKAPESSSKGKIMPDSKKEAVKRLHFCHYVLTQSNGCKAKQQFPVTFLTRKCESNVKGSTERFSYLRICSTLYVDLGKCQLHSLSETSLFRIHKSSADVSVIVNQITLSYNNNPEYDENSCNGIHSIQTNVNQMRIKKKKHD